MIIIDPLLERAFEKEYIVNRVALRRKDGGLEDLFCGRIHKGDLHRGVAYFNTYIKLRFTHKNTYVKFSS